MKNWMCLLITICILQSAQAHFDDGQVLTVMAPSGLTLRSAPHAHAPIIQIIGYGSEVTVVNRDETAYTTDRIDWADGKWIMVSFEGDIGYVFDGFLSDLPMPMHDFELSQEDMDLIYPFESWMDYRFDLDGKADTLVRNGYAKTIRTYKNGYKLVRSDHDNYFRVQGYLSHTRIMDVYHVLQSMLPSKVERSTFGRQTVFIENEDGQVTQIKINLNNPVDLRLMPDGRVRVSLYTTHTGCSL